MEIQKHKPQTGGALTFNRVRSAFFSDAAWEDRFEQLIKYTQRTRLIFELTGSDALPARMKAYVRQRLKECGITPILPRGNPPSYESRTLLRLDDDRFDAAYLVALHYGARGPGEFSEVETDLGQALDKRLEVYGRYRSDLYPFDDRKNTPRLGFEDYIVLIRAIEAKVVHMRTCPECRGSHPFNALHTLRPVCPFCGRMKLEIGQARTVLEQRSRERKVAQKSVGAGMGYGLPVGVPGYRAGQV
jgi:hypothetical protein